MSFITYSTYRALGRGVFMLLLSLAGSAGAAAQGLLDEMAVDGETVKASQMTEIKVSAPTAQELAQRKRLKAALWARQHSLWGLVDSVGNPLLNPQDYGAVVTQGDSTLWVGDVMVTPLMEMPLVFDRYDLLLPDTAATSLAERPLLPEPWEEATAWADRAVSRDRRLRALLQRVMTARPDLVRYNMAWLPEPPKEFRMTVDPSEAKITIEEFVRDTKAMKEAVPQADLGRINWLNTFETSLQFSQAYVSPNWYQGGNSNLNAVVNVLYRGKLNQAYHPNLLCEFSVAYKLGINNAPDDSIHSYSISEDILQANMNFGLKASGKWYYSLTGQFKTQIINNYAKNSRELKAAFLSPGELNVGLGMTYATANKRKTFTFNASLSPAAYNLKMCTNHRMNPVAYGIEEGHTTATQIGSTIELTCRWNMTGNIEYSSRMFFFTDYGYAQGDWENTFNFSVNRFISARIYAHLRYQSNADPLVDSQWHKWQFKEILSIGFAYKFSRG